MTLRVRAVSDEEREQLGRMARSRTVGAGLVRRAQIILHALDGLKVPAISTRMDLCGATVGHWCAYCLIRGCSRAGGDCLTRMFPVPHLGAPVAA
jgi:hypothetical protein